MIDSENQYVFLMTPEDAKEFRIENSELKHENIKIIETNIEHYTLAEQTKLPQILKAQKCDLWHFLNFNVPSFFHEKYVVTIHDLTLFFYQSRTRNDWLHKLAYKFVFAQAVKNSTKVIAVSDSTKKDIVKVFDTDQTKIKVIYEAADDKEFKDVASDVIAQVKSKYHLGHEPIILYVGQWRQHKNVIGLIKAFETIRTDMEAKLVLVGKIDPAFPEVLEAIDKSPCSCDIIKTGFADEKELTALYKIATVFAFPSFYEGFGLPGLEAMSAGLPVAASERTSLPEIYQEAAIYFDPDIIEDMATKIKKVITDSDLRQKMVNKGYEVAGQYSWRKAAKETLEIYKEINKK